MRLNSISRARESAWCESGRPYHARAAKSRTYRPLGAALGSRSPQYGRGGILCSNAGRSRRVS